LRVPEGKDAPVTCDQPVAPPILRRIHPNHRLIQRLTRLELLRYGAVVLGAPKGKDAAVGCNQPVAADSERHPHDRAIELQCTSRPEVLRTSEREDASVTRHLVVAIAEQVGDTSDDWRVELLATEVAIERCVSFGIDAAVLPEEPVAGVARE